MARKLSLSLSSTPAMTLGRAAVGTDRLVYILAANKRLKYPRGRSRIVYIGTTKRGVRRVAASVSGRAVALFEHRGVSRVDAHLLRYTRKSGGQKLWLKLERAILFMFRYEYGTIPVLNKVGRNFWPGTEFAHFSKKALLKRIRAFEGV